jgi:hypothetical protein
MKRLLCLFLLTAARLQEIATCNKCETPKALTNSSPGLELATTLGV